MTVPRLELDYWADYGFRPRLIAVTERATWLVEEHLPILISIDPRSHAVSEPRPVARPDGRGRGAHELVASADAVWIRWNDGISRLGSAAASERWLPLSAASLAVGDVGVWALSGDGRLVRIDPDGGDYVTVGDAEVRRHTIAVGQGAVWTLTWTSVPAWSTLSRIDPDSGRPTAQVSIEGSPRRLMVDDAAVWVRVWRHGAGEPADEILVGVDPDTIEPTGEIAVVPAGAGGPVLDGVLWALDSDPYAYEEHGASSAVRRIDARTGALLGAIEVPGRMSGMAAGPTGVWGCLERPGEAAAVVHLDPALGEARVIDLGRVDVSSYVPSSR